MPEFERTVIREALKAADGGRQDAAKLLGWGRNTLTRKLKELGMDKGLSLGDCPLRCQGTVPSVRLVPCFLCVEGACHLPHACMSNGQAMPEPELIRTEGLSPAATAWAARPSRRCAASTS